MPLLAALRRLLGGSVRGPRLALPRARWLALAAGAAVAAVAVGLLAGREFSSALLPGETDGTAGSPQPPGFVRFHGPEGRYSIAYPRGWTELESGDGVDLLASGAGGGSLSVRTVRLPAPIEGDGLAAARELTDELVARAGDVTLLTEPRTATLDGLPVYFYFYSFAEPRQGRGPRAQPADGVHSHYFVFDRETMIVFVLQARPVASFAQLAPTFDAVAASFRDE